MKLTKLSMLLIPLLIAGCSSQEEAKQYRAIEDSRIMRDYYRQHTANQAYLSLYTYSSVEKYDPTYDAFGDLRPIDEKIGLYYESNLQVEIGLYSGYFIESATASVYKGNKSNIGSLDIVESKLSFWFRDYDEGEGDITKMQLIKREEVKDNDLDNVVVDTKQAIGVEKENVSGYFANNINAGYEIYFPHRLSSPADDEEDVDKKQIAAYMKTDTELVETCKTTKELAPLHNQIHPSDNGKFDLTVIRETNQETTFKLIDGIGWVGTDFVKNTSYYVVTDFEQKLLEEPRVIRSVETKVSFTYSQSLQPYTGETYIYKKPNEEDEKLKPTLYEYVGDAYVVRSNNCNNVTDQYKLLHPEFSGYAYQFQEPIELDKAGLYSFACAYDVAGETPNYETIGANQISGNNNQLITSVGAEGHNFFRPISNYEFEFVVLISSTGTKSFVAHLAK